MAVKVLQDFDDSNIALEADRQTWHPYEYQTENNNSWAGALPVKQYVAVPSPLGFHRLGQKCT